MNALRVITIDDEKLALRRLKLLLQSIAYVEHIAEASSCAEAISAIASLTPDVILLDIRMRDGDGFDVIEALADQPQAPTVIFVTAFDHYAVRAFESAVVDYLLKPVERERLSAALSRARQQILAATSERRLGEMREVVQNLRAHAGDRKGAAYEIEFWLRSANGLVRVPIEAIDCVSSEDDYVAVHTARGSHLLRGSIRQFESRVEPGYFVRVHRGWLVRRSAIGELKTPRFSSPEVMLRSGKRVPVGRVYLKHLKAELRERFVAA